MKFAYSSIISSAPGSRDFLLLRRPEIPVTVLGPTRSAAYIGLVDTGSDNTIFPMSVADYLGISVSETTGPEASVFGGSRVRLLAGQVRLRLEVERETIDWSTPLCFYQFPSSDEETVILGHAGFLDYFTATFEGDQGILTLVPNGELPRDN